MKLFTLGYQSLSPKIYVRALVNAGVGMVVDVREHAWSQRPAFVKSSLENLLINVGIDYLHVKSAGNPSANRKSARSAKECLSRYREHLLKNSVCVDGLIRVVIEASAAGRPACLTCYERNHAECHRSVLVEELLKREPFTPIHLEPSISIARNKGTKKRSTSITTSAFLAPALLPFK